MEKIVKTRKEHKCGYCGKTIPIGASAFYIEGKYPLYKPDKHEVVSRLDDKQVGIKY